MIERNVMNILGKLKVRSFTLVLHFKTKFLKPFIHYLNSWFSKILTRLLNSLKTLLKYPTILYNE